MNLETNLNALYVLHGSNKIANHTRHLRHTRKGNG